MCALCVLQGLLSVTEELHSLGFEACFTVQGLTIDLEVRASFRLFTKRHRQIKNKVSM